MKWRNWVWIGLAATALGLYGCGSSGTETVTAPSAPKADGKVEGKLEVAAFKGGYGIDFYEACAKEFAAKHAGVEPNVWGDPRVWEKLRPRFVAGEPPDVTLPGWGMDHWALAEEGELMDLTEALKSKPEEGEGTWGDTFEPALLALAQLDGKQYTLPYYFSVMGWWFDPGVFAKNGWTPPKTWTELIALCEKIKASGMAPITFQGKYPYYMLDGMLLPWCQSIGGKAALDAAQNLEPGAWKSPAMLEAAMRIHELNTRGFFQRGAVAMSHTESQQEFLQGRAAMIPCGTWLESEMRNVMPKGAKMAFMLTPHLEGGTGDASAILIGIEPWMVPSKAKNPQAGIAFFRFMSSLSNAKKFVETKGTLTAIKGSDQANLPDSLKGPAEAFRNSKTVWAVQYRQWYPAFDTEVQNALTAMLNKELTPEQFCERVEAAAEKLRNDDSIKKHKVAG